MTKEGPPDDDSGNPSVDFRGEGLRNETHGSRTDPEARLMRKRKGKEARLSFMGHALMENGNGHGRRDAVPVMLDDARQRGFHLLEEPVSGYMFSDSESGDVMRPVKSTSGWP